MEAVFHKHHPLVFRVAYRVTGNAADAEDVVQTVFLRMVRKPEPSGGITRMESYLYRAAANAAVDLIRARQRSQDVSIDDTSPVAIADSRQSPERALAAGQIRDWLREAVANLSPVAAETFVLRFFEDKGNSEIAEILGTTPATVAVTLHRARTRLEREYRAELGG
jgi:RNA polymerase sigma-70 factor (ECF subfamily)